jgi:hypothetical protein
MNQEYDTWELAKAYEAQGYYQDALDILVRLNRRHEGQNIQVLAACRRLEKILEKTTLADDDTVAQFSKPSQLEAIVETWLRLWIIKYRKAVLDNLILHVRSHR